MSPTTDRPWWDRDRHADRRPALMARNRIQQALRGWLAGEGFVEVDPAAVELVTLQPPPAQRLIIDEGDTPADEIGPAGDGALGAHPDAPGERRDFLTPHLAHDARNRRCSHLKHERERVARVGDHRVEAVRRNRLVELGVAERLPRDAVVGQRVTQRAFDCPPARHFDRVGLDREHPDRHRGAVIGAMVSAGGGDSECKEQPRSKEERSPQRGEMAPPVHTGSSRGR